MNSTNNPTNTVATDDELDDMFSHPKGTNGGDGPPRSTTARNRWTMVTLVAAGAAVGAIAVSQINHGSGATTVANRQTAAMSPGQGPVAGGAQGQPPAGGAPQGQFHGGGPGGPSGEQRLSGTVTAVGSSSVTVQTSSGTTSYVVTSSTQIIRDGHRVALSAIKAGDPVFVHVYPSNGQTVVERLFAGTSATT